MRTKSHSDIQGRLVNQVITHLNSIGLLMEAFQAVQTLPVKRKATRRVTPLKAAARRIIKRTRKAKV